MLAGHWSQSMPEPAPLGHTESKEEQQADIQAHKQPCETLRLVCTHVHSACWETLGQGWAPTLRPQIALRACKP